MNEYEYESVTKHYYKVLRNKPIIQKYAHSLELELELIPVLEN